MVALPGIVRFAVICSVFWLAVIANAAPEFLHQSRPTRLDPFEESMLQINPPTFRWPAEYEAGARYRLEFSRDPDFALAQHVIVDDLFHRPLVPFAPGKWYWRARREAASHRPGAG